jgi:GNAT superfamily N-acetyltransferase
MAPYEISCNPERLDIDAIHDFLAGSYWAAGIPKSVVERALANSLCFGVYRDGQQVGLARVITDRATFAYLSDVYILPEHRAKGLAKRLLEEVIRHPELQGLRRMLLFTRDAHTLYAQFGFKPLAHPERVMDLFFPDGYGPSQGDVPGFG